MLFAEKIAQEKGVVIPDEAKVSSAAMSAWIEPNLGARRGSAVARLRASLARKSSAPQSLLPEKRPGRRTADAAATPPLSAEKI